ncbi:MAG: TonB-dependent receptor domain-containing protein [Thermoanaerobaculia bacterium]
MRGLLAARILRALTIGLFFGVTAAALAQTDVTTSRISGIVSDPEGGALPGVTVTAKHEETGLSVNGVTDSDGSYRLLNLPTGTYNITAELPGVGTAVRENVKLVLGSAPTVNFTLNLAGVTAAVTASAEAPLIEVTNTSASTSISEEQIRALPVAGRDFRSLVLLTPATRFDSERGNLAISGQRGINTNVTIDGVDFNNAFFGGTVGGAEGRAPLAISQESIKEFTVITNGASVEFGRTGGGVVNVITKSGTNEFHGSAFYYWQPQDLISDFAEGECSGVTTPTSACQNGTIAGREPSDQEKKQYGASLGGPIMKDRIFFFGSYDNQDRSETVQISPDVLDADIFARYPILGSPETYVSTQDGSVLFGRLDFHASSAHRFMMRGNFTDYEGVNGTSTGTTRTESYNGIEGLDTKAYVASYSAQFTGNLLNDLNLNYITEDTPREDKGLGLPEIQLGVLRFGEVSFLPIVSATERKAIGDTVTFLIKEHVAKVGGEYNDTTIDQIFKGNWRGVYVFNNEADLLAGRYFQYRQFGGLGGLTSDEAGNAAFGQKELAFFAQDQWFVSPRLTVTAGVRWERLDNPDDPILNQFELDPTRCQPNSTVNCSFRLNGQIPDADSQWSPRLGISWSPDPKTAIRVAAGRYWSRTPAILWAQLFTSNGVRATQYLTVTNTEGRDPTDPNCRRTNGTSCFDPLAPGWGANFSPVGVERIDFRRVAAPTSNIGAFTVDPDFDNPYTDRVSLVIDREIFNLTSASLDFTYAKAKQLQRLVDINRVYDGTVAANGLPRYSSTRPNTFYGTVTTSVSDAESEFVAITAQLQRRYANNFAAGVVATWSQDRDNDSNERNFAGIQAEDFNDLDTAWGYSNRDQRWKASANVVWDTPVFGLTLGTAFRFATGSPFNPTANFDFNNDGQSGTDRPTLGCNYAVAGDCAANGRHLERNSFRQSDFYSLDMRLGKIWRIGPTELNTFIECFNCTDASNLFVTSTVYGREQTPQCSTSTGICFGDATSPGTPRTFQVAARFSF